MTGRLAVETERLGYVYAATRARRARVVALTGVTLHVTRGEMFGIIGPNGAGKTTLMDILSTELVPTTGIARVAGFDVARYSPWVRPRVGRLTESARGWVGWMTVGRYLSLAARRAGIEASEASRRIGDLLDIVGLRDRQMARTRELSTGLRQRLAIVRGFLTHPMVLFLDQPTLGLDVMAAHAVHDYMRRWLAADRARTVVLTTHALGEAETLCDRVAVLRQGRLCACDAPAALCAPLSATSSARTLEEVFVDLVTRTS
jgi:ABC-2 type transport system ATP-binding protein